MRTSKLFQRVQKNVHTIPNNKRNIDIPLETIIVLGYTQGQQIRCHETNNTSFVMMGKFVADDYNWDYIELRETIVLDSHNINSDSCEDDILFVTQGEDHIETAEWWRIPTDDEMKLYNHIFNKNSPIYQIGNLINQCKKNEPIDVVAELIKIENLLKSNIE